MNFRDFKKQVRSGSVKELEEVAFYLDRIWDRKCPPPKKDAPVATVPTAAEFRRELMAMHVDDRELLLASSKLHEIIDNLRLVLPSKGGAL